MTALLVQADPTRRPPCYAEELFEMPLPAKADVPRTEIAPPATVATVADAHAQPVATPPLTQFASEFHEDTGDLPSIVPANAPQEDVFAPPPKAPELRSPLRKYLID